VLWLSHRSASAQEKVSVVQVHRWVVASVVAAASLVLAGCERPLVLFSSENGSGVGGSSNSSTTAEEAPEEDEELLLVFGTIAECVVGDWEYDNQSFADLIAIATGQSPITVTGEVLVTFGAADYTATYRKWSAAFSAPEGTMTQIIDGVEKGTWSITGSDQMSTQVTSDETVGVLNLESPQGNMSFPTNESDELGASLSGPMTCDQDSITLTGEGGLLKLNRR